MFFHEVWWLLPRNFLWVWPWNNPWNFQFDQWSKAWLFRDFWGIILPSHIGIIISHYKDPGTLTKQYFDQWKNPRFDYVFFSSLPNDLQICSFCLTSSPNKWWFQLFFLCSPQLNGKIPILTHIFQRGWFNHQLDEVWHWCIENHPSSRFQWLRDWSKTRPRHSHGAGPGRSPGSRVEFPFRCWKSKRHVRKTNNPRHAIYVYVVFIHTWKPL